MGRSCVLVFLMLFMVSPVTAAQSFADPMPRYEPNGAGFSCHMSKVDYEKSEAAQRDICMRIGPASILMYRSELEKLLGTPTASRTVDGGEVLFYALQSDETNLVTTYVIAKFSPDGRVDVVQLTGKPWSGAWKFCGLTLGDAKEVLTERLGAPKQVEASDDPGAEQWSYRPWAFSFEVKGDVISSIRVAAE